MLKQRFIKKTRVLSISVLLLVNMALVITTVQDAVKLRRMAASYSDMKNSSAYLNDTKAMVEDMLDLTRTDIEKVMGAHADQKMINPSDLLNGEKKNEK